MDSKRVSHDAFVKKQLTDKRSSLNIDTFKLLLTPGEFALFDWGTLTIETTTYISKEQREKRMDVVFSVCPKRVKRGVKIILLLEHKSYGYSALLKQSLHYQACIYDRHPYPVIPILLYHGRARKWTPPLRFHDSLKGLSQEISRKFGNNILDFKVRMLNLREAGVTEKIVKSKLTSRPMLYTLANIWELSPKKVSTMFTFGEKLSDEDRSYHLGKISDYIRKFDSSFSWKVIQEIEDEVIKQEEKRVMPVWKSAIESEREKGKKKATKAKHEGIEEGIEKGRIETAVQMLKDGLGFDKVKKHTGLADRALEKLMTDLKI